MLICNEDGKPRLAAVDSQSSSLSRSIIAMEAAQPARTHGMCRVSLHFISGSFAPSLASLLC